MMATPERTEAAPYYFTYIDRVAAGDIRRIIRDQEAKVVALAESISEEQSRHRYGPDKWSIREVLAHLNDCERLFVFRAFWFARGFESPLPSFDQHIAMAASGADARSWRSHLDEFRQIRASTVAFFDGLPDTAWDRRGIASDNPFTVRALAYMVAGHVIHHVEILRQKYL